jgi:hypothetical protein
MALEAGSAETSTIRTRSQAMNPKTATLRTAFAKSPAACSEPPTPAKPGHNAPPTVEQFDRERMGIAAKE